MSLKKTLLAFFVLFTSISWAQMTIKGHIVDANGAESIPGVNILVQGTGTGSISDLDGNFSVEANQGDILLIRFIGYKDVQITITDQTNLGTISIAEDAVALDAVVVVGYGTMKKSDLTGSVASVNAKNLEKLATPSVAQALQGQASGVQVTQNSGSPGDGVNIKIRGTGTINNSSPLYVVDGVIVDDITNIDANDIASMEILKDAASSAIYGSRAANGVVLITTKQGKEGKLRVNAGGYFAIQDYWKEMDMMDTREYIMFKEIAEGTQQMSDAYKDYSEGTDLEEMYFKYGIGSKQEHYDTRVEDWVDQISQKGQVQKYYFNLSGGSDKVQYYLSANNYHQDGLVQYSEYDRTNVTADMKLKLTDNMSLRSNFSFSDYNRNVSPDRIFNQALIRAPIKGIYTDAGYLSSGTPYGLLQTDRDIRDGESLAMKLYFDWNLAKGFTFQSRFSYFKKDELKTKRQTVGDAYYYDVTSSTSYIENKYTYNKKRQWENILSYSKNAGIHSFSALAVMAYEDQWSEWFQASSRSDVGDNSDNLYLNSAGLKDAVSGTASEWRNLGFVGRLNYNYDDRYLVQANMRADASSRFQPSSRWGFFPSASLGWRMSEENVFSDVEWLDMFKVRTGWGQLGNNRISNYGTFSTLTSGDWGYGTEEDYVLYQYWTSNGIANPNLKWEKTTTYNGGVDFTILSSISGSVEYFQKYTTDMLLRVPISPSAGMVTTPYQNAGSVLNKGWEFSLTYDGAVGNDFSYTFSGNISLIKNEVLSLGDTDAPVYGAKSSDDWWVYFSKVNSTNYRTITQVGHPIGEYYGWVIDYEHADGAVFRSDTDAATSPQSDAQAGDFRFKDLNNDGKIDEHDRAVIGSPHPDFIYGINFSAQYKGFDFSAFFQGVHGIDVFNELLYDLKGAHGTNALAGTSLDYYMDYGIYNSNLENRSSNLPRLKSSYDNDTNKNYRPSNFYIEDASYLRLKNVQIGYTLPKDLVSRIYLQKMRLYFSGQNLFTFTDYTGLDPEVGGGSNTALGFDSGTYPQARMFQLGVDITF